MSSQKLKKIWFVLLPLFMFISGCSYPRQKIIDDVQLQSVLGFDKVDNEYVGTALYSDYTGDEKKGSSVVLQGKGKKAQIMRAAVNIQSPKPIEIGKLNLLIFGKELAEMGVSNFVETICRDPLIGSNMYLAVSDVPAGELLNKSKEKNSKFLYKLIEQNYHNLNIPIPTLHSFLFDYYGEGRDSSIPYLKINQKGNVEVSGLALFKKDKLALTLNQKETVLYKILRGRVLSGEAALKIHKGKKEDLAVLSILNGQNRRSIVNKDSNSKVRYEITLEGMVKDYPDWLDLRKKEDNLFMKKHLENQMKKDFEKLFVKLREHGVDPLGIGDLARAYSKKWNESEFYKKVYSTITLDVNVKIQLFQSGIGE